MTDEDFERMQHVPAKVAEPALPMGPSMYGGQSTKPSRGELTQRLATLGVAGPLTVACAELLQADFDEEASLKPASASSGGAGAAGGKPGPEVRP